MTLSSRLTRRGLGRSLAAGAALVLVLGTAPAVVAQDAPEVIRIGSTAPGHLKFALFRNLGLLQKEFEAEGIDVQFVTFDGGSAASVALGSGELDLMYTGNNPALRLAASGANVKAVGLSSWLPKPETLVVVRPDSDIQNLEDLEGRKVGFLLGTVRHSVFSKALASVGLSTADIEGINFGIENSGPALARGDIDAVVESTATAQKLIDAGVARAIYDAKGHPEWSAPYPITANGDFAERYPEVLTRILAADIRLAAWVDEHPEETIRIFVDETGNAEASVRETYADGVFYQNPEITDAAVDSLRAEEAFMAEADLINGEVDYATWIDRSYYEAALETVQAAGN